MGLCSPSSAVDLRAYNIAIRQQPAAEFHGYEPTSSLLQNLDPDIVHDSLTVLRDKKHLATQTHHFLMYLKYASDPVNRTKETQIAFVRPLLRDLGYEDDPGAMVTLRHSVPDARFDGCVIELSRTILLITQIQDAPSETTIECEARLVASAIAAFRENNRVRDSPVDEMLLPCLMMANNRPTFYKVRVTKELSDAIQLRQYPSRVTEIAKCEIVMPPEHGMEAGMECPPIRALAFQYLIAFRTLARSLWEHFCPEVFLEFLDSEPSRTELAQT